MPTRLGKCGKPGLLISLSNIGDAVMTTPALEALHRNAPECVIDVVVDRRSSALFSYFPYIRHRFERDKRSGFAGTLTLLRQLRAERYAYIVDLRTDGLAFFLRSDRRATRRGIRPQGPHAVQQHMAVVHSLLGEVPIPDTRVWLPDALKLAALEKFSGLDPDRCIAFGPGANYPGKIWPVEHFVQLAAFLESDYAGVVLIGSEQDLEPARQIETQLRLPCVNFAGSTDLLEAAALLSLVDMFVGNDSGLGHLAAAVGTPTLTLFGPGRPERYRPWGSKAAWLVSNDGHMESLKPARVAETVRAGHKATARTGM